MNSEQNKDRMIARKFRFFSIILFAVVLLASSLIFIFASRSMGYEAIYKSVDLTAETAKLRLSDTVNSEVLEIFKLANLQAIQEYFLDPTDHFLRYAAEEELMAYYESTSGITDLFWVSDVNKLFYTTTTPPYVVDPTLPENSWYNMTLYETELYNFNVNYNEDLDAISIWVNVPVFSDSSFNEQAVPIGMLGTGLDISQFMSDLSEDIDSRAKVYVFNSSGAIMISEDLDIARNNERIQDLLGENGSALYERAMALNKTGRDAPAIFEARDSGGNRTIYLTDYMPSVDWYVAVTYPVTIGALYGNSMTVVFFVMLAVIALVLLISNVFMRYIDRALQGYISDFTKVTADKERIATELNVATQIQTSMLPSIFPPFPDRSEFDVYASMLPAKEVGGDFYDFFLIDNNTLAIVMADVSGKGVPAALFMVIAKTLIKNNAQYEKTPQEVFEIVNNLLCENNEAGMFVTCFMGFLDLTTGDFTFVNAGHNPPLLRRSGEKFEFLEVRRGFVLAGMENMFYRESKLTLSPGDELFMYTDGVTEATNRSDELFSDPRLLEVANKYAGSELKEFTVSVKREIDAFADGAEQADDITMLILRFTGSEPTE
ncbi:MAG: SpoIIE family protein phosphatase [Oscillospiraceae bacterium]|jgi:serine phosphatase RsbU (regulator of sigma subunit)|nr:SpoIIE family protein phosphatase [Oscillospiraceae bacterium]